MKTKLLQLILIFVAGVIATSAPAQTWIKINDTDSGISYSPGDWTLVSAPGAYMGDAHWCDTSGECTYTFTGTQIRYYTFRYDGSQTQAIYIDDQYQQDVTSPAGPPEESYLAYESGTLTNSSHTIKVVTGAGEAHVDAFEYLEGAGDTDPPSPDPMTWASVPAAGGTDNISMTATTATDPAGVEYFFDETSGNPGGSDSGWQASASYTDTGLNSGTQYCYQVKARDQSANQNETAWSTNECATTDTPPPDTTPPTPDPMTWATAPYATGDNSIAMVATTATDPSGVEYYFDETSGNPGGSDSGWQDSTSYSDTGLNAGTQYCYNVQARDKSVNQNATAPSSPDACATTTAPDTTPPTPNPMTWSSVPSADSSSAISMTATTATDPSGVEYYFMETSANPGGSDSGWQDPASYTDSGLNPETQYCYEVQARDKSANQNLTNWSTNECATTLTGPVGTTFYVAPGGNDTGAGTIGDPWATLAGARDNIRPLLDGTDDITVYFRGGTYTFDQTVVFDTSDDGTANQIITYAAYPGETPIFSSLVQVTGWSTYSGSIMQANLPGGISRVRYLHDESENWLELSSTGYFRPNIQAPCGAPECEHWEPGSQDNKSYTIYPSSFSMPDPSKASQYDLRAQMTAWHAQVMPITNINTGSRRIDVGTPSHYPLYNGVDDLITECWVLNSIAGIETAGEWACIDGKIYLWPLSGTSDIYAPALEEMVRIDAGGSGLTWTGTPVQYINFDGITFTGCDYRMSLASDIMGQHDWTMVDVDEGFLKFRNAANCNVTNCTFTKSGCDGVRIDRYAQNIIVDNCEFSYMGKNGVTLTGRGPKYGDVNKNNTVINCHFNSTSRIKWDSAAVHIDQSSSNLVKQCYFEDLPMSAVIVSGCRESNIWEMTYPGVVNRDFHSGELHPDVLADPDSASAYFYDYDNIVEECTFRAVHIGRDELIPAVSQDAPGFTNGMIYTTGRKAGGTDTFRKNYFYDCDAGPSYSHTWVFLGDGHEDYLDIHQNMSYDMDQTNPFEPNPWMSNNCSVTNGCSATANVKLNCFGFDGIECGYCQNTSYAGNIDFDTGTPGGSSSYVSDYEEMWSLLCPGVLPGPSPLPGSSELQTQLASKITSFGGTVPTCGPPDTDPPTPDPMTWASAPGADSDSAISMTATTATDDSGVEYYFDETSGNPGGSDSGWQDSTSYTDSGLNASTQYCYRVQARDKSANQNATAWSTPDACATTEPSDSAPPTPDPMTWASVPAAASSSQINMTATTATDPSGVEYLFDETSGNPGGSDSDWQDPASYTDTGLSAGTQYCYRVQARDKSVNQNATAFSTTECATTDTGDCHVEVLVCSEQRCGGPNRNGVATVTIYDDLGAPVVGADVTGTFTGSFNEQLTETTNQNGVAVLVSTGCLKKPTFEFCVDDVDHTLPYDSGDNLVTCCND